MAEQEFHDAFVGAVVRTMLPMFDGFHFPDGLDQAQARRYHATFLQYFSFFAWGFPSWLGSIATRCPYQDVRRAVIEDLVDEEVADIDAGGRCHIDILYDEAEACGLSREEIAATPPTPILLACVHALENVARTLRWEASYAGLSALEVIQSEPASKLRSKIMSEVLTPEELEAVRAVVQSKSLAERTGLRPEQLAFQAHHAYKDQFHGGTELALIVKYATTREIQDEMMWAARTCVTLFGTMRQEIDRVARARVGLEPVRPVGTPSDRMWP